RVLPAALRFLRAVVTTLAPVFVSPTRPEADLGPGVFGSGNPVGDQGRARRRREGVPRCWEPWGAYARFFDLGRTGRPRPSRCAGAARARNDAGSPAAVLSGLPGRASARAVYAWPPRGPVADARRASGCGPGSARRDGCP